MKPKPIKVWANPADLKLLRSKKGHVILLTKIKKGGGPMATTQPVFLHELQPPSTK